MLANRKLHKRAVGGVVCCYGSGKDRLLRRVEAMTEYYLIGFVCARDKCKIFYKLCFSCETFNICLLI